MNSEKFSERPSLKGSKTKKRDPSPELPIYDEQQDAELNRELQKKVYLGEDFIP